MTMRKYTLVLIEDTDCEKPDYGVCVIGHNEINGYYDRTLIVDTATAERWARTVDAWHKMQDEISDAQLLRPRHVYWW